MKIIEPKVELWQQGDDAKAHVARCARVCYGRETGNDEATIKRLINDGHWSMFRHGTYYMIANDSDKTLETIVINYANTIGFSYHYEKHVYYITVNGNWVLDHKTQFGYLSKYIVPIEDFCTRCVYTYSINEWRAIIDLRYYGITGKPHPNAKIIAGMIRNNLMELGYDFRDL